MNIQKEMQFLKEITMGLFNKKGISFQLGTHELVSGGKRVRLLIVNDPTTVSADNQRISMVYQTNKEDVEIEIEESFFNEKQDTVKKEEVASYMKDRIKSFKETGLKDFSEEEGEIDFYQILEELTEEIFVEPDTFEFNGWQSVSHLHTHLNLRYKSMKDMYHVHGGVGMAQGFDDLHSITMAVEMGKSPEDEKNYMLVQSDIAKDAVYSGGMYPNATADMFKQSVVEQYKGAWNKRKFQQ